MSLGNSSTFSSPEKKWFLCFLFFPKFLFPNDQIQPCKKHLASSKPKASTFLLVSEAKHILHGTWHQPQALRANTPLPKGCSNEELGSGISHRTLIFMVNICKKKKTFISIFCFCWGGVLKWPEIPESYFILSRPFFLASIISSGLARKVGSAPVQVLNGYSCVSLPHWYN